MVHQNWLFGWDEMYGSFTLFESILNMGKNITKACNGFYSLEQYHRALMLRNSSCLFTFYLCNELLHSQSMTTTSAIQQLQYTLMNEALCSTADSHILSRKLLLLFTNWHVFVFFAHLGFLIISPATVMSTKQKARWVSSRTAVIVGFYCILLLIWYPVIICF